MALGRFVGGGVRFGRFMRPTGPRLPPDLPPIPLTRDAHKRGPEAWSNTPRGRLAMGGSMVSGGR
jgi:hypothetical protein